MDKKSKILFLVFFLIFFGSVGVTYQRYLVDKNYTVETNIDCDPSFDACFIHYCDAEKGEECTGDTQKDTSYYKILHRNVKNIPLCDPSAADCSATSCSLGEVGCEITTCDSSVKENTCSDFSDHQNE